MRRSARIGLGVVIAFAILIAIGYAVPRPETQPHSVTSPPFSAPVPTTATSVPKPVGNPSSTSPPPTSTPTPSPSQPPPTTTATNQCDQSLWNHVYNPERLKVIDPCKTVSGIIEDIRTEKDGDYHILLKLDSRYNDLINTANIENQHGDLVLETICQHPVEQQDAVSACENFSEHINIPAIGSHVNVTGSYVLDSDHSDWAEIHPVTSVEVIEYSPSEQQPSNPAQAPQQSQSSQGLKKLTISIAVAEDPIVRGNVQTITIMVSDQVSKQKVAGALVDVTVTYASGQTTKAFSDNTDNLGQVSFSWRIGGNSAPGTFTVAVDASTSGYEEASTMTSFEVIPAS